MDWIQGDKFIKLGKYIFAPQKRRNDDYDKLPNTLDVKKLKDGDIIYTHTIYVKELFEVIKNLPQKVVVVSHNGDVNIDFPPPDNVIKWYTQNVNIKHERIQSIPIGLENDRWFSDVHKKEKMLAKVREPKRYNEEMRVAYMNFNISTNPAKRELPYKILRDNFWVTTDMGSNGHRFDEYLDNLYKHKFVICPEGNGMDTHRTWEALYIGTIPIEVRNINNSYYENIVPILLIDDWSCINETNLLLQYWWGLAGRYYESREALTFEYWKNKILKHE